MPAPREPCALVGQCRRNGWAWRAANACATCPTTASDPSTNQRARGIGRPDVFQRGHGTKRAGASRVFAGVESRRTTRASRRDG